MRAVAALLMLALSACGPNRRPRIVFDDYALTPESRTAAVAQIESETRGGYEQYQFRVQRYPILFSQPVDSLDFGVVTQAVSWTDLDAHVVYLTWADNPFRVQDLPYELSQIRRLSRESAFLGGAR